MTSTIQFLSIALVLTLALPGTTILWSKSKSSDGYLKSFANLLEEKKSFLAGSILPCLKRLVAVFF